VPLKQFSLTCFHPFRFFVNGVVPTKQVQHPVHDEQRDLVVE
jgi:hypothetical protein